LDSIIGFFKRNPQYNVSRISGIETKGLTKKLESDEKIKETFSLASDYIDSIFLEKDPNILRVFFDRELKKIASRDLNIMPKRLMLNGACYPGNKKLFVDTGGTFYICERFGKRLPIGDVFNGLREDSIMKSIEDFTLIRNNVCTGGCWAQRLCTPCIQSSKDSAQEISEEGLEQLCISNQAQLLTSIAIYAILANKSTTMLKNYLSSLKFK